MVPTVAVPACGGKGSPFAVYEQQAILWPQVTALKLAKRAAAWIPQMSDAARHVSVTLEQDHVMRNDGARHVAEISRGHFDPDAVDAIHQEVGRSICYKRTDPTMDVYLLEFDVIRRKAAARMAMGAGSSRNSSLYGASRIHHCQKLNSRWSWPVFRARWLWLRGRLRCVDFLDPAGAQLVRTFWLRRMWTCPQRMRMITQHG